MFSNLENDYIKAGTKGAYIRTLQVLQHKYKIDRKTAAEYYRKNIKNSNVLNNDLKTVDLNNLLAIKSFLNK